MQNKPNDTANVESLIYHLDTIRDIKKYNLWGIFAMGFPGNLLITITVQSIQPLSLSSLLVSVVAMFDTLAIVFKLVDNQLYLNNVSLDSFVCKMVGVFSTFFSTAAVWSLALLCVQQWIFVRYPTTRHRYLTKSRSCIIFTSLCFAIFAGLVILYFVNIHSRFIVIRTCAEEEAMNYESLLVIESLHLIIPYITLTIFVMSLHCSIGHFKREYFAIFSMKDAGCSSEERKSIINDRLIVNRDEEITLVNMTRAAVSLFLILSLAKCGYVLLRISDHFDMIDLVHYQDWSLITELQNVMLDSTFCLKFLLYFIVSATFRKHFVNRFLCQ